MRGYRAHVLFLPQQCKITWTMMKAEYYCWLYPEIATFFSFFYYRVVQENGEEADQIREDSKLKILAQVVSEPLFVFWQRQPRFLSGVSGGGDWSLLVFGALWTKDIWRKCTEGNCSGRPLAHGLGTRKRLTASLAVAGHPKEELFSVLFLCCFN